jgi:hypothetical protein
MPSKKKSPREMTTAEIAKKVFPKKVIQTVKEMTKEPEKPEESESSHK